MMNENEAKRHNIDPFSQLTDNQWRFVTAMVENPSFSKKAAAEYIGLKPETVYKWDSYVDDAIERARHNVHEAAVASRKQALLKAIAVKRALLDSDDENVRSKAATEIIEWELGRASQRQELTGQDGGAITINVVYDDDNDDD